MPNPKRRLGGEGAPLGQRGGAPLFVDLAGDEMLASKMAAINLEAQDCIARRKAGGLKYVWSSTCINNALEKGLASVGYRHMDLIRSLDAYRLSIAEQLDSGALTEAQGLSLVADKASQIVSEETQRNALTVEANAADEQARLQMMEIGLNLMMQR